MNRWIERYVGLCHRRPWWTLAVFSVITLVATLLASQLKIRTDLRLLLPSDAPSVQALELSEKRLGSTDFFTIAFEDSSATKVARFQRVLADSLRRWKEAQWVQYDEDRSFFLRHALVYMPLDQLKDLEARLRSMSKGAAAYNPLGLDLMDEGPSAPPTLEGWPNPMPLYKQGIPMDVVEAVLQRIDEESGNGSAPGPGGQVAPTLPDSLKDRMMGWHPDKKVWVGVVVAQLKIPSTEASFAQVAKSEGERLSGAVQAATGIAIHSSVVGAYRDPSSEIEEINGDMWVSSVVAIALILGLLLFYMRRPANVLVVFIPLVAAMVWMMGAAEIVYGRLTVLTSFVLALLSGLGVEYSIHVYSRWVEQRRAGEAAEPAMVQTLQRTGRSLFSAMLASIGCMLALQVGHFQGFKEFGIVVSMGIFLAFLSSVLLLPPLLFALLRVAQAAEGRTWKWISWFAPSERIEGGRLVPAFSWSRAARIGAFSVAAFATVFLAVSPRVQFENDFANLRGGKGRFEWISSRLRELTRDSAVEAAKKNRISYGRAVGKGRNTTPSLILGSSEAQMREIHDSLGRRFGTAPDSMLKSFVTIRSFVPDSGDQAARLAELARIRAVLDEEFHGATPKQRAKLAELRRFTNTGPVAFDSLPGYARRLMTESDGSHGKFGFLYGEMRESDAVESRKYQERFGTFRTSSGTAPVASSGFIYADVVALVKSDVGRLALATMVLLTFVVWLDTRSLRGTLLNMGYVVLIALWTYGAMGWLGLRLGMFNIVVLPALLSNTVDATIHLYHRRMELGAGKLGRIFETAGSSVLAGTLTNAFGFMALVVVAHQGLNTIGMLACLGYASAITLMFTAMPFLLEALCPKEPQAGHGED